MSGYVYDQAWEQERARLAGIEAQFDPGTIAVFRTIGVGFEWECLEVGAGGGSIAAWLCDYTSRVVATDLDPRFLGAIEASNLEVRAHDIVNDPLEEEAFDLVHSRMLLEHLPARDDVVKKLAAAVKPGGWLFLEDLDFTHADSPAQVQAFPDDAGVALDKGIRMILGMMRKAGYDPGFALRLPGALRAAGLVDVSAELHARLVYGGSPEAAFSKLTVEALAPRLVEAGAMTAEEAEKLREVASDPNASFMTAPMVSAWGRKPQ